MEAETTFSLVVADGALVSYIVAELGTWSEMDPSFVINNLWKQGLELQDAISWP